MHTWDLPIDAEDPVVATREPDKEEHAEYHLREFRRARDQNDTTWPTSRLGVVIKPFWSVCDLKPLIPDPNLEVSCLGLNNHPTVWILALKSPIPDSKLEQLVRGLKNRLTEPPVLTLWSRQFQTQSKEGQFFVWQYSPRIFHFQKQELLGVEASLLDLSHLER